MNITDLVGNDCEGTDSSEPDPMFDSLVRNAIDFLKKSVGELEKSPKYSVIHFCSAIELFLKARLLTEHWTLIILDINKVKKRKKETILSKFKEGDIQSVGMIQAIRRLREICHLSIPKKAEDYFDEIRKHRNKLIHFFHPDYSKEPDFGTLHEIIPEQWSAWYHLQKLLLEKWRDQFSKYEDEIDELHDLIRGNRKYLSAKFEELRPKIEEEKRKGVIYNKCSLCGYDSSKFKELYDIIDSNACLVCHYEDNSLHIPCPNCNNQILIEDMGVGQCDKCNFETDLNFLIEKLGPYQDPKEDPVIASCAECEFPEPSVITMGEYDDDYFCLYCLTIHGSAGKCVYCNVS